MSASHPFLPRGMDHESLRASAIDATINLHIAGGVGSADGGATKGSKAMYADERARNPALSIMRAEELAELKAEVERKKKEEERGKEPNLMLNLLDENGKIYESFMSEYPARLGRSIAKRERTETDRAEEKELIYSECGYDALAKVLHMIKYKYGVGGAGWADFTEPTGIMQTDDNVSGRSSSFADIGSGIGKPCIIADAVHCWKSIVGIELLEGLHVCSVEIGERWEKESKETLPRKIIEQEETTSRMKSDPITFYHGDFRDQSLYNWASCDVVFCNGTTFPPELWSEVSSLASRMRPGSFFISSTREVEGPEFVVLEIVTVDRKDISGKITLFLHQRKSNEAVERELEANDSATGSGSDEPETEGEEDE